MIYLQPEVRSGLGEDTFWTWFHRTIGGTFDAPPTELKREDIILQYSTLGAARGRSIALLWELLPEMREVFQSPAWDAKIERTIECAKAAERRFVATPLAERFYKGCGKIDVLPLGVDMDLFAPVGRSDKETLRTKYGIPAGRPIGFWGGTMHPMKGFARLQSFAAANPEIYWVIVWKTPTEAGHMDGASNFTFVPQQKLAELMNCCDFVCCSGMLRPFYMIEWEAMACDLEVVILDERKKDFEPSEHPRDDLFMLGWDRQHVEREWRNWLALMEVTW